MLRASLVVVSVGLSLASLAALADVYKYTDPQGNVIYTDRPEVLPAQKLKVQAQRTDTTDEDQQDEGKALADREKARKDAQKAQADKKKAAETNASSKAELCAKARENYLNRMNAGRLYEEKANGERRFLDEKELEASRSSAKQAMDALCN